MNTIMTPVEAFSDRVIELAQIRQELDIRTNQEVIEQPDTAQILRSMEAMVVEHPEIVHFYKGALDRYSGKSEAKQAEQTRQDALRKAVIRDRLQIMNDVGVISNTKTKELLNSVATGEYIIDEATLFFKMFKRQVPAELMPKQTIQRRAHATDGKSVTGRQSKPRQARNLELVIEEHGGIRVNGTFLRGLTEPQKLIILSGLAKGAGFRDVEIYSSPEFAKLFRPGTTTDQLKELYKTEWANMQELLIQKGFGRLLDPTRKPREKKHYVVAQEVTDRRSVARREVRRVEASPVARKPFYHQSTVSEERSRRSEESHFDIDTIQQARQAALTAIAEKGEIRRADLTQILAEKFHLVDPQDANALMRLVYASERVAERPVFGQLRRAGGKWFVPAHRLAERTEQEQPQSQDSGVFGSYFTGSEQDFDRRFGGIRAETDSAIFYERGTIFLESIDKELIAFFKVGGIKQAVSEKSIIDELAQRGIEVTKEEIRQASQRINALYKRQIFASLQPSKRAAKGFRLQLVGSI